MFTYKSMILSTLLLATALIIGACQLVASPPVKQVEPQFVSHIMAQEKLGFAVDSVYNRVLCHLAKLCGEGSMQVLPALLLTTKLYRPRADDNWVLRPLLLARLNAGVLHKLILVSVPPGFGKSTLVSQWLAQLDGNAIADHPKSKIQNACWLSLDEGDNQLVQFLRYLIVAVRTCEPAACPTTQSLLDAAQLPGVDYLADVVVSELSALTDELVIVLDDYHLIRSNEVHQVMRHLLRYMPPRLHLVILSRTDPPLHLGRLRIEQQITELRAGDLRFALADTRRFLEHQLGQTFDLDDATLDLLHTRTEGWITALQLSSIAIQGQDPNQFFASFRGSNRLLVGYLVEEVMEHLPEPLRDFLLHTAVVDRFCAPLADALLADRLPVGSSQALIAELEAQNLFLIPLDPVGEWFRFHDLFRDFLRHQLQRTAPPARLTRLHQLASAWFAAQDLIEDAVRHTLAAGDESGAAELVISHFHAMLDRQFPGPTLLCWLVLFPPATIQTQPGLLFAQFWLAAFGIGPAAPAARLADIEARINADPSLRVDLRQALLADINLLRGVAAYWDGEPQRALDLLRATLVQQLPSHLFGRAQALIHLAVAYTCIGKAAIGRRLLRQALTEETAQQRPTLIILLGGLAIFHLHTAELAAVIHRARQAVAAVDELGDGATWQGIAFVEIWYAWAHYLLGIAYYEQNDLAAATQHWRQVEAMRYRTNPTIYHGSLLGLALIAQADGATNEARAYAQAAREFAVELRSPRLLAVSAAFAVRLALRNGQVADAERQTQEIETSAGQGMAIGVELPLLTRLRALLAAATPTALSTAVAFAATCLHNAESTHNTLQIIQIGALQALILHSLRRSEEAYDVLARTLALGEAAGFVRTFVDLGAPQAELLRLFASAREQAPYIKQLLAAFPQSADPAERRVLTAQYAKLYGITPLTPREIELLVLIRQRLSINEIAAALVISPNTVKKHASNVYTKLGVRNRRQALAKAEELNLLPPA